MSKKKEVYTFYGPFVGCPYLGMEGTKENSMDGIDFWVRELGLKKSK